MTVDLSSLVDATCLFHNTPHTLLQMVTTSISVGKVHSVGYRTDRKSTLKYWLVKFCCDARSGSQCLQFKF